MKPRNNWKNKSSTHGAWHLWRVRASGKSSRALTEPYRTTTWIRVWSSKDSARSTYRVCWRGRRIGCRYQIKIMPKMKVKISTMDRIDGVSLSYWHASPIFYKIELSPKIMWDLKAPWLCGERYWDFHNIFRETLVKIVKISNWY